LSAPKKVEIDIVVHGAEECIAKMQTATKAAKELRAAIDALNDLSFTLTTTHQEKGEGIERQRDG
jgi:phage tail sheath gpL-like